MFLVLLSSFVFGQSHATVSAGFTNVSSLAVAAFDLNSFIHFINYLRTI